jgi:hypothetical protein
LIIIIPVLAACGTVQKSVKQNIKKANSLPTVGSCYKLTKSELNSASPVSNPVSCSTEHNSETYKVVQLPTGPSLTELADSALHNFAQKYCLSGLINEQNFFSYWAYFIPTNEQWNSGQRWIRCDGLSQIDPNGGDKFSNFLAWAGSMYNPIVAQQEDYFQGILDFPSNQQRPKPDLWYPISCRDEQNGANSFMCFIFLRLTNTDTQPHDFDFTPYASANGSIYESTSDDFIGWKPWDEQSVTVNPNDTLNIELHFWLPSNSFVNEIFFADGPTDTHAVDIPIGQYIANNIPN